LIADATTVAVAIHLTAGIVGTNAAHSAEISMFSSSFFDVGVISLAWLI
jgi:hypothetical protein